MYLVQIFDPRGSYYLGITMLQFIDRMGLAGEDFCQGWRIFIVINKKVSSSMSDSCSLKMPGFCSLSLKKQWSSC